MAGETLSTLQQIVYLSNSIQAHVCTIHDIDVYTGQYVSPPLLVSMIFGVIPWPSHNVYFTFGQPSFPGHK